MPAIVENVVYQHAENVCSLWLQRQSAVEEPHYSFADLVHLDNRVEANLEGMRVAGDAGSPFLRTMLDAEDEGAFFALTLLALEAGDQQTLEELYARASSDNKLAEELKSAFAWCHPSCLKDIVKTLLNSENETLIILGLHTCAAHNKPPGDYLARNLRHDSARVRTVALRTGADIGGDEFSALLWALDTPEDEAEKFELARAIACSDKPERAASPLAGIALSDSPWRAPAVDLAMQLPQLNTAKSLLKTLDGIEGRERDVVRGFGLLGDPAAINWLIDKTEVPKLARQAGGSISMITGIDLALEDLETLDEPEGFSSGPDDNPQNDEVALDEDENLPWPDTALLRQWWGSAGGMSKGTAYLDGREKTPGELQYVLVSGMQRQRNAAAAALAIRSPKGRYRDTRLPTSRQKEWSS